MLPASSSSSSTTTTIPRRRYRYTDLPVGRTRLLELIPGPGELKGKIHVIDIPGYQNITPSTSNLTEAEPLPVPRVYHALSHHWEAKEVDKQKSIFLLHGDQLFDLSIRPSLHAFLLELRDAMRECRSWAKANCLWVDAICINQDSDSDKTNQLPRMGAIYNGAESVLIWLGPSTEDSIRAVKFIARLQDEQELSKCLTGTDAVDEWRSFAKVTRLPWFARCWIVQEIAAAKKAVILIGKDYIEWDTFAGALSLFGKQYEEIRTLIRMGKEFVINQNWLGEIVMSRAYILVETKDRLLRKRSDGTVTEHNLTLEALLTTLSSFGVSNPHDVVYSILWLSRDANVQQKHSSLRDRSPSGALREHWKYQRGYARGRVVHGSPERQRAQSANRVNRLSEQYLNVPAKKIEEDQLEEDQLNPANITLDYKMSVFKLVKEVFEHVIDLSGSLDILCYPWAPLPQREIRDTATGTIKRPGEPPHPTWVQAVARGFVARKSGRRQNDVSKRCGPDPLVGRPGTGLRPYRASGQIKARGDNVKIDGRILRCVGWLIATVKYRGDPASDAVINRNWLTSLGWKDTDESPPDVLWRLLVGNKGADHISAPPTRFKLACKWLLDGTDEDENINLQARKDDGHHEAAFKEFVDKAISTTWNRRLFFTDSCPGAPDAKFIGLGPQNLEVGDKVCILFGCSVPVLLKPYHPPEDNMEPVNGSSISQPKNESAMNRIVPTVTLNDDTINFTNSLPKGHDASVINEVRRENGKAVETPPRKQHEAFVFKGECYVDELMDGEVFDYVKKHKTSVQDFFIY